MARKGSRRRSAAGARTIEHASLIDDEGLAWPRSAASGSTWTFINGDWIDEVGTRDGWPAEYLRKNRDTTDLQREGFAKAVKLGVPLTYGTRCRRLSARPQCAAVRATWSAIGMTPMQALASATSEAAKALGRDDLGSVDAGPCRRSRRGRPRSAEGITVLQCVDGVIQGGRLVHRDDAAERCDRWKRK